MYQKIFNVLIQYSPNLYCFSLNKPNTQKEAKHIFFYATKCTQHDKVETVQNFPNGQDLKKNTITTDTNWFP